ncbi:hypothetical protein QCA50_006682 [Cerrena zonata]|uniref:Uncharacterized protein n=1 Tax=Cerrena zonata TaxID=2478898 RepID=A0AAW0GC89_9APHY
MSRAAALRQGIVLDAPKRVAATKESLAKTFANVPGHKRSETISVASTAPPAVAPRMTRAASLRLGQKPAEQPRRASLAGAGFAVNGSNGIKGAAEKKVANGNTFEGVPGHKRRESIQVASTRPPTVAPRLNKSASLRVQKDSAAPPSSFMFRGSSQTPSNGPSRSSSRTSMNTPTSTTRQTLTRPASSQASSRPNVLRTTTNTSTSTKGNNPSATNSEDESPPPTPKPRAPRPSSIGAPTIAPRQNKSAMLRAAKMAATNAAATAKTPVKRAVKAV